MSLKYPYDFSGKQQQAHQARQRFSRYEAWAASHPRQAYVQDMQKAGLSAERVKALADVKFGSTATVGTELLKTKDAAPSLAPKVAASNQVPVRPVDLAGDVTNGALAGVVVGASVSAAINIGELLAGRADAATAGKRVAVDASVAAGTGAAVAATAAGIRAAALAALPKVASGFAKGAGPVVVAAGAVSLVTDACMGRLTAQSATKTVVRGAVGWAGAEAGAATGAAVGAFLAPCQRSA